MNWLKPPPSEPSRDYFVTSECGLWRICKAYPGPVYTLSHRGALVRSSQSLDELKEIARDRQQ